MNGIILSGWGEFQKKLKNLPSVVFEELDGECKDGIDYWEELAKNAAPHDTGPLRQNIVGGKVSMMNYELTSKMEYSAYMEWGTGSRAVIPPELATYAARWWTKKQHVGIRPHPFFFVQMPIVERFIIDNIKNNILNREH